MPAGSLALELMLLIAVGMFVRKSHIVGENFSAQLASLLTKIILPCMIVNSMQGNASLEELRNCGFALVLSLLALAVQFVLGQLAYLWKKKTSSGRIFRFGFLFTNFTFIGIPVVESLYGPKGVLYFVVYLVPLRLLYYSCAPLLLSPPGLLRPQLSIWGRLRPFLSPPLVATCIGLLLYFTGWQLPAVLGHSIATLGGICSPMGMLLCGLSLGEYDFRRLLQPRYATLPLLRLLALPALFFLLARALPLPWELTRLMVLCAALPTSSLAATFTLQYDPNPEAHFESAGVVFLSTLLSALTIPLWAQWLAVGGV